MDEQRFALEISAVRREDVRPNVVGVCRRQLDGRRSSILEERTYERVESLSLAEDAADVLLHYRVVGDAITKELCGRRDRERRVAQLMRDGGGDLLRKLNPITGRGTAL